MVTIVDIACIGLPGVGIKTLASCIASSTSKSQRKPIDNEDDNDDLCFIIPSIDEGANFMARITIYNDLTEAR